MLSATGIEKHFGGLVVLTGVEFEVAPESIVGLIGPNGAGKTTLFNIVTGFIRPDAGTVHFGGHDITRLSPTHRSRLGMARTFQVVKPFARLSVLENVMVGAFSVSRRASNAATIAKEALTRVGLANRAEDAAESLTLAGRKRLELARCLATRPQLLLLDEVMSGLNPTEMAELLELVRTLRAEGLSIVVVEHIMDAIRELADEVFVLNEGEILHRGPPREVLQDPRVVEAYLGEEMADAPVG